jgi:hypothetical protein
VKRQTVFRKPLRHEWFSSPIAASASPLAAKPVAAQTTSLPVPLRSSLRATANRLLPPTPVPDTRGPCSAPFGNCVQSAAARTSTRTVTAGPL